MKNVIGTVVLNDVLKSICLPEDFVDEGYSFKVVANQLKISMFGEVVVKVELDKEFKVYQENNEKFIIVDGMCLQMYI